MSGGHAEYLGTGTPLFCTKIDQGGSFRTSVGMDMSSYPEWTGYVSNVRVRQLEGKVLYNHGTFVGGDSSYTTEVVNYTGNEPTFGDNYFVLYAEGYTICRVTFTENIDFSEFSRLTIVYELDTSFSSGSVGVYNTCPPVVNAGQQIVDMSSCPIVSDVSVSAGALKRISWDISSITANGYLDLTSQPGYNNGLKVYEVYLEK